MTNPTQDPPKISPGYEDPMESFRKAMEELHRDVHVHWDPGNGALPQAYTREHLRESWRTTAATERAGDDPLPAPPTVAGISGTTPSGIKYESISISTASTRIPIGSEETPAIRFKVWGADGREIASSDAGTHLWENLDPTTAMFVREAQSLMGIGDTFRFEAPAGMTGITDPSGTPIATTWTLEALSPEGSRRVAMPEALPAPDVHRTRGVATTHEKLIHDEHAPEIRDGEPYAARLTVYDHRTGALVYSTEDQHSLYHGFGGEGRTDFERRIAEYAAKGELTRVKNVTTAMTSYRDEFGHMNHLFTDGNGRPIDVDITLEVLKERPTYHYRNAAELLTGVQTGPAPAGGPAIPILDPTQTVTLENDIKVNVVQRAPNGAPVDPRKQVEIRWGVWEKETGKFVGYTDAPEKSMTGDLKTLSAARPFLGEVLGAEGPVRYGDKAVIEVPASQTAHFVPNIDSDHKHNLFVEFGLWSANLVNGALHLGTAGMYGRKDPEKVVDEWLGFERMKPVDPIAVDEEGRAVDLVVVMEVVEPTYDFATNTSATIDTVKQGTGPALSVLSEYTVACRKLDASGKIVLFDAVTARDVAYLDLQPRGAFPKHLKILTDHMRQDGIYSVTIPAANSASGETEYWEFEVLETP